MEEGTRQVRPARRRTRLGWRVEILASSSVALLALFVSAYTVYIQRQQLKVQAWPRLVLEGDTEPGATPNETHFTLSLKNRGLAPAEVRTMHVSIGGEDVTDWLDWLERISRRHGVKVNIQFSRSGTPTGSVIGAGQEFPLIVTDSPPTESLINADDVSTISICYCSVLDDCWVLDVPPKGTSTTSPVSRCPTYATNFVRVSQEQSKQWVEKLHEQAASADAGAGGSPRDLSPALGKISTP